jgi:alkylhydroperoxidase family enzyme
MRIPYAPTEPATPTPENRAIYERIKERRKPRPLIPLDLALLHNPEIADGYNKLMGAIRTKSSFPLALAELAIGYIAVLNSAVYEWAAHAPIALRAGATREALEAVLKGDVKNESVLSEDERLVLGFTEQSTKSIKVEEDVMEKLKERFSDQQVMELAITVAGYNMVSRFLVALDVTESNGRGMEMPKEVVEG